MARGRRAGKGHVSAWGRALADIGALGKPSQSSGPSLPTLPEKERGKSVNSDDEDHWNDRGWVLDKITSCPGLLKQAPAQFQNDFEIVLAAVTKIGTTLSHASDALRNDRDIVKKAVEKDGDALRHASKELQADREIVLIATKRNISALRYASEALRRELERTYQRELEATKQQGPASNASGCEPSGQPTRQHQDWKQDREERERQEKWEQKWVNQPKQEAKEAPRQEQKLDPTTKQEAKDTSLQEWSQSAWKDSGRKDWSSIATKQDASQKEQKAKTAVPQKWFEAGWRDWLGVVPDWCSRPGKLEAKDVRQEQKNWREQKWWEQEWKDSAWRGWPESWSSTTNLEAKETGTSAGQDESYKDPSPEAALLPTLEPRYRCPHCFRPYFKWSQCQQHIRLNIDCKTGIQEMSSEDDYQDLCKIVSAKPSPTDPVFQ